MHLLHTSGKVPSKRLGAHIPWDVQVGVTKPEGEQIGDAPAAAHV